MHIQELKGKFLIKGKRLDKLEARFAEEAANAEDTDVTEEEESDDSNEDEEEEQERKVGVAVAGVELIWCISAPWRIVLQSPLHVQEKKKLKLAKELSDMVIYCKSVHFSGFEDAKKNLSFYEMSSFKEGKAMKLVEETGEQASVYTARFPRPIMKFYRWLI